MHDIVLRLRFVWPSIFVLPREFIDEQRFEAADEIERLREALRLIAAPSKIVAKEEDMAVALQVLLSSHRQTALDALGEKSDHPA